MDAPARSGYEQWAPFYDAMRGGEAAAAAAYVRTLVERHRPDAETLLELGCGTGAVLEELQSHFDVTGVDLSDEMLRIARKKLPRVRFVHDDVTRVHLGQTFDVVISVADVVNHLRPFHRWEALFARAHEHLADGGIFVFDMN